jgi:RecB family exonuclease
LSPKAPAQALEFGTAIHAALEVYYEPNAWTADREMVKLASIAEFEFINKKQLKARDENPANEILDDYKGRLELGIGMLEHYFQWAERVDDFTPIAVEQKFEVPISGRTDAVYRGKIDMLAQDSNGGYWIWDHKTTARMEDREPYLEIDEQCGSYAWALQVQLGIKVLGVVYNELFKGFPQPPAMNSSARQGRWFSVNRQQDTSYEVYLRTITEANEPLHLYEDFLNYLKAGGKQYFRRTQVHRSQVELLNLGNQIALETEDMLDPNLKLYPNPNKFRCKWCDFRAPCLATNDGSDVEWILQQNYKVDDGRR